MSRIDEALSRARGLSVEAPAPVPTTPGVDFIHEESAAAAPDSAPVPPEDLPLSPTIPVTGTIEAAGSIDDLPVAEKLMLTGDKLMDRTPIEQYRRLAARLLLAKAEHGVTSVMITSALPGEGKTLTASNLALTLSESYRRSVLLVDADLRRRCIHHIFQGPNAAGLNDGVKTEAERKVPLIQFSERLTLLTAGRPDADPMSVLSGSRMRRILDEAKERFDLVIVDTPPVTLLTDAHLLATLVDVVVVVVRAGVTPLPSIKKAVDAVGKDRVLGIVMNHAEVGQMPERYSHYYADQTELQTR